MSSSSSSFRIGRKTTASTGRSHESGILRSLFELRKRCNGDSYSTSPHKVMEVTFFNCRWTERITHSLNKLIVRDGHRFSSIKFFDCDVTNPKFGKIISMILNQNAASKLVIKGRKLADERNESNEQIRLPPCETSTSTSSFDDSFLHAIGDGISTNTSLKYLKLSGFHFKNTSIGKSCDCNVNISDNTDIAVSDNDQIWCHTMNNRNGLQHLDLSGSYFSKLAIGSISRALSANSTLQSIKFGGCNLDDQSLLQILKSVKEHPTLTKLDLSQNFLAKSASTKAVDAITELLKSNDSKLESLDLSKQQSPGPLTVASDSGISMEQREMEERHKIAFENALNALSRNESLQRIDLSGNSGCFMDMENVKALTSCLATNSALCHVDVSSCHLNPAGICHLAQKCIPRCSKKLKSLILFDSETRDSNSMKTNEWSDAFLALKRGLQFNSTLESLGELDDTGIEFELRSSLQYLMNENRGGRRALQSDDLPIVMWPDILARAGRIEYNIFCQDDESDDDRNKEDQVDFSSVTSASVIFALLHGPAMLEQRRQGHCS